MQQFIFPDSRSQPLCLFIWLKMRITHVYSRVFCVCYIGRVANLKSNQINFLKCYLVAPAPSSSQHFWPWRASFCSTRHFIPVCLRSSDWSNLNFCGTFQSWQLIVEEVTPWRVALIGNICLEESRSPR